MPEWMQCATRAGAEAAAAMKRSTRAGKGVGRPRGTPPADVDEFEVMTLREVAEYLDCHKTTVYKLPHQGKIPCLKLGGEWRFLKADVDKWVAKGSARQGAR